MVVDVWLELHWFGEHGEPQVSIGWADKYIVYCYLDREGLSAVGVCVCVSNYINTKVLVLNCHRN